MKTYLPGEERQTDNDTTNEKQMGLARKITAINITPTERLLSGLGGGALAFYGMVRKDRTGASLAALGSGLLYRGLSGHSFLYQFLKPHSDEEQHSLPRILGKTEKNGTTIKRSITINSTPQELYEFWRKLENAPRFMPRVISVKQLKPTLSHWVVRGPNDKTYEWDAELLEDEPGKRIAWQANGPFSLPNAGSVSFTPAPGERGTVVTLEIEDAPLKGPLAKLAGKTAEFEMMETLRRFKELMEAGEVPSTAGQPAGHGRDK